VRVHTIDQVVYEALELDTRACEDLADRLALECVEIADSVREEESAAKVQAARLADLSL